MLKRTITYTDFNGEDRTEDFYFNLTKTELVEMETSVDGGLANRLRSIVNSKDPKDIFNIFKKIVLSSVGFKSDDGRRFVKNDQVSEDFVSSPAFDVLFMDLASSADKAANFVKGIIPQDLIGEFERGVKEGNVVPLGEVPVPEVPTTEVSSSSTSIIEVIKPTSAPYSD